MADRRTLGVALTLSFAGHLGLGGLLSLTVMAPGARAIPLTTYQVRLVSMKSQEATAPRPTARPSPPPEAETPVPPPHPPQAEDAAANRGTPTPRKPLQAWWRGRMAALAVPQLVPREIPSPLPSAPVPSPPQAEDVAEGPRRTEPSTPETGRQRAVPLSGAVSVTGPTATGEDFPFPVYLQGIEHKVSREWTPPPWSGQEATRVAVVQFVLVPSGRLSTTRVGSVVLPSVEVERSSGDLLYDEAALRAVLRAKRFGPFPEGLKEPFLRVHFAFTLRPPS